MVELTAFAAICHQGRILYDFYRNVSKPVSPFSYFLNDRSLLPQGEEGTPRAKSGGKPLHLVKKKLGIKTGGGGGGGGGRLSGKPPGKPSKIDVLKKKRLPDMHRKRAYKAKVRGMFGAPAVSLQVSIGA